MIAGSAQPSGETLRNLDGERPQTMRSTVNVVLKNQHQRAHVRGLYDEYLTRNDHGGMRLARRCGWRLFSTEVDKD